MSRTMKFGIATIVAAFVVSLAVTDEAEALFHRRAHRRAWGGSGGCCGYVQQSSCCGVAAPVCQTGCETGACGVAMGGYSTGGCGTVLVRRAAVRRALVALPSAAIAAVTPLAMAPACKVRIIPTFRQRLMEL